MGAIIALLGKDRKPGFVCSRLSAVGDVVDDVCFCSVFLRRGNFSLVFSLFGVYPCYSLGSWEGFGFFFCVRVFEAHDTNELDEL